METDSSALLTTALVDLHPKVGLFFSPTPPIFDIKGEIAAIVYSAATPLWLAVAFMVWYLEEQTKLFFEANLAKTYKSTADIFFWYLNVGIWSQLLIFFTIVMIYDSAITR